MIPSWAIVRALSLSRVALGLVFVVCFRKHAVLLWAAFSAWLLAWSTDVLDGHLARRWGVASVQGRLWDSLGDKSFYAGVIVAFNSQGLLGPVVSWALIVREIALYITRILYLDNLPNVERIRPLTNGHGYLMYVLIGLGFARVYSEIRGTPWSVGPYTTAAAYGALGFGVASIAAFIRLRPSV